MLIEAMSPLAEAASLIRSAMHAEPLELVQQTLTESGNTVYRADLAGAQTVVLRMSPLRGAFAHTANNLNVLRTLGLPVQSVLGAGGTSSGGAYIVLSWLPGRDLVLELPLMQPGDAARIAGEIAAYQRRVAMLPLGQGFGFAPIGRPALAARWSHMFGPPLSEPVGAPPTALNLLRARLRALRRELEAHFSSQRPVCFLDDLTSKNVIVEHGKLTGVIDFDLVCYGDPLLAVGNTLAQLAAQPGEASHAYGEALVETWKPVGEARRAMHFYSALWLTGAIVAAEAAGNTERAHALEPSAHAMLDAGGV